MDRQPCGTNAAYQYHIEHHEPICDPCRAAHTLYIRARRNGTTAKREPAPCGTQEGYMHHRYSKTPVCEPCREAHCEYNREWRAKRRERAAFEAMLAEVWAEVSA